LSIDIEAQHAAELALLAMALRSALTREQSENPEASGLTVTATRAPDASIDVDVTVMTRSGLPIGGFSL